MRRFEGTYFGTQRNRPTRPLRRRRAPIQAPRRWSLRPRLALYLDRLELTEWWGWRRVWCRLPLDALNRVDAPSQTRLALRTEATRADCPPLTLHLDEAEKWASAIRAFRACLDADASANRDR